MKTAPNILRYIFAATGLVLAAALIVILRSDEYAAIRGKDTVKFNIRPVIDQERAAEIREYFQLDTLYDETASTWEKTLAIARFVATNIPHANQTIQPEKRNAIYLWEYT